MRSLLLFLLLTFCKITFAQEDPIKDVKKETEKTIAKDPADTIPKVWKVGGTYNLNISLGTLSNWAAGGDDYSLSLNSMLNVYAFYKKGRHSWDNTLDFNLGYVKTTTLGDRKNDDRFDVLSKYGYALKPKLNLAALFNFRTQFFKGYNYEKDGTKTLSSDIMSPGYFILSPGLDYKPNSNWSIFISPLAWRLTIVNNDSLSAKGSYGVDPGKNKEEVIGAFLSVSFLKDFNESISYKSRLDLYSNYNENPENIDVYFTNTLTVKLSSVLALTWSVDMIYDDDVRIFGDEKNDAGLQLKSLVGVGLLAKF